jgi:hypothetical protein
MQILCYACLAMVNPCSQIVKITSPYCPYFSDGRIMRRKSKHLSATQGGERVREITLKAHPP